MAFLSTTLKDGEAPSSSPTNSPSKVVIFSQWVGMHELIIKQLERRKGKGRWEHVFLHGGVPGRRRREIVSRFREDPRCRIFLSTDAGGVGLNLQAACHVVNMDLPWNPAVLEQRIGRVHRLGQERPVQVVNFIAERTIEEGMLAFVNFEHSVLPTHIRNWASSTSTLK